MRRAAATVLSKHSKIISACVMDGRLTMSLHSTATVSGQERISGTKKKTEKGIKIFSYIGCQSTEWIKTAQVVTDYPL